MSRSRAVATTVALVIAGGLSAVALVNLFVPEGTFPAPLIYVGYVAGACLCLSAVAGYVNWRAAESRMRQIHKHLDAEDFRTALPKLRVMVADCENVAGPQDPITMEWRHCLADTLYKPGRVTEALRVTKINLDGRADVLGRTHPHTKDSQRLYETLLREIEGE